jgi:hypothetical protein
MTKKLYLNTGTFKSVKLWLRRSCCSCALFLGSLRKRWTATLTKQKDALWDLEQGASMMALKTLTPPPTRYRIQQNQFFFAYVPQLLLFVASPYSNPKTEENFCIAMEVEKGQVKSPVKRKKNRDKFSMTPMPDNTKQVYLNNCSHIASKSRCVNECFR